MRTLEQINSDKDSLRQQMAKLDNELIQLQRLCKHPSVTKKDIKLDYDYYSEFTCNECEYSWDE